jgi:asparaginyl-tRNA synthetase
VHTPIITASDAEGAGDMFRVTTLDLAHPPMTEDGARRQWRRTSSARRRFSRCPASLRARSSPTALSSVYTFGPTFRAENSHTSRHASEFWMIEPEVAFCDLAGDMDARRGVRETSHP